MTCCQICTNNTPSQIHCDGCNQFDKFKSTMAFKTKKELYLHIWNSRPHISELSGKPLLPMNHFKWHWQFLHILAHGHYPSYKFNPDNIMLALPEEHEKQEEFPLFVEKQEELRRQYYKEVYGKTFD